MAAGGMSPRPRSEFFERFRSGDLRSWLTRYSDLALAALVASIVGMMIVPLPAPLLDLLIALNMALAVTLLLVAIYVSDSLRIATFPTLLLLTTLFRLALEVSATRLILLHGRAGDVIHAFGSFVVAGNLVVGAVIFVILTVIQFVVISKGAERVAEVAARFTLDAMPGKQMSIDAELRAGHIDHEESRRRRTVLTRESQLFGAMDGAMKFVKGDAIAGVVVLAVNIIGGLIIGIVQRGLEPAAAARTYTLLTIGEGLVAQIPALLISTAAGIVVTRVAAEEEGAHLGQEIAGQILRQPKAIAIAAGLLGGLALIPGLPFFPFMLLAAVLGFVAGTLLRRQSRESTRAKASAGPTTDRVPTGPLLVPIAVELGSALAETLCPDGAGPYAARLTASLRERVFTELGLPLPALTVRLTPQLEADAYVLRFNDVPLARGRAAAGSSGAEADLEAALLALLRRYGHEFIDIQATQQLLDGLAQTHPALVREAVPKLIAPTLLTEVLRRLVEEGVSLRHLAEVLSALAAAPATERDPLALTERARGALRRSLSHRHAAADGRLPVLTLEPMIEEAVRDAIHKTADGSSTLALEPQLSRDIVSAIGRAVAGRTDSSAPPVILTNADIRRYVRRLIEAEHPALAVLAYPELAPEAQLQMLGQVRVG